MSVDREVHYRRPRSDKDCRSQLKKKKVQYLMKRKFFRVQILSSIKVVAQTVKYKLELIFTINFIRDHQ
jgi:hypothetical protein